MIEMTKRLQKSLDRISKCGGVVLLHHTSEGGTDYLLQNGKQVSPHVITKLRELRRLEPGRDGLFGGCEQTLHVVAA